VPLCLRGVTRGHLSRGNVLETIQVGNTTAILSYEVGNSVFFSGGSPSPSK
jgi:hypothetical protein